MQSGAKPSTRLLFTALRLRRTATAVFYPPASKRLHAFHRLDVLGSK